MKIVADMYDDELEEQELDERVESAMGWLNSAEEVAFRTDDRQAKEILGTILAKPAIARIIEGNRLSPVLAPRDPSIILVPVIAKDQGLSKSADLVLNDELPYAQYTEGIVGWIFFNGEWQMTDVWKAFVLFHEAAHAQAYEKKLYSKDDPDSHWLEEVDVFEFEFRLVNAIGGKEYAEYRDNQLRRFVEEYKDEDGKGGPIPLLSDLEILDDIFGKSMSDVEFRMRKSIIRFELVFRLFERVYPSTALRDKMEFIKQMAGKYE